MKVISHIFILMVRGYQVMLSPLLPPSCRYTPSCSHYSVEAFRKHGALRGFYLTTRRVCSCNPWGGHGHDPVP